MTLTGKEQRYYHWEVSTRHLLRWMVQRELWLALREFWRGLRV